MKKEKKPPKNRTQKKLRVIRKLRRAADKIFDEIYALEGFNGSMFERMWIFNHGGVDSTPKPSVQVECKSETEIRAIADLLGATFTAKPDDVRSGITFQADIDGVNIEITGLTKVQGRDCQIKKKMILVCGDQEIDPNTLLDPQGKQVVPKTIGPAKGLPPKKS